MTRREVVGAPALLLGARSTDVRVVDLHHTYEDFKYRAPYKFGGMLVDRVTMLNVHCVVCTKSGKRASGFASMPMGNMWSWPAPELGYDKTLAAMKGLAGRIAEITRGYSEYGHPLEINHVLEPEYLKAAGEIPKLCMLVTASPFDAALHDAFGKLVERNAFNASGREFVRWDLSRYLGAEFRGEYLDKYVLPKPVDRVLMYHSVGASDALTAADVKEPVHDGLPESLEEWIPYSGVRAIKIKLNGNDLAWDVERVAAIARVAGAGQLLSLDFNEKCPNVEYLLEFIGKQDARTFARVQYIEQPTKRDLERDRANVMFEAAKRKPVVIDESLTGLDRLKLAREMGYSGAALKACKGQSQSLLIGAAVQKYRMFRCVQDLTCPGAAFVHSAQLASHIPGTAAVEANAREYVPSASVGWEKRYPGLFDVRDGWLDTRGLSVPGLGTSKD